jgi:hypothetical protein
VQFGGDALQYLPEDKITPEICLAAVQEKYAPSALCYVPKDMMTEELCLAAVKIHGDKALRWVPKNLKAKVKRKAGL